MEDNQIQKEIQSQNQLSNDEIISWGQLLSEAKDTLTKANVPDADIDAWLLLFDYKEFLLFKSQTNCGIEREDKTVS